MKIYQAEVTFAIDFAVVGDDNPLDNQNEETVLHDILEDMHLFAHPNALSMEMSSIKGPWLNLPFSQAPHDNEKVKTLPLLVHASGDSNSSRRCGRP